MSVRIKLIIIVIADSHQSGSAVHGTVNQSTVLAHRMAAERAPATSTIVNDDDNHDDNLVQHQSNVAQEHASTNS